MAAITLPKATLKLADQVGLTGGETQDQGGLVYA